MFKFCACDEHIEYVIDDFINLYGVTPDLNLYEGVEKLCCNYCDELAKYMLAFIDN